MQRPTRGLLPLALCAALSFSLTAQDAAKRPGLDERVRASWLVEIARIAVDARKATASWRSDTDPATWASDPAIGVAFSPDARYLGVVFRTEKQGSRAAVFDLETGTSKDVGPALSIQRGALHTELLLGKPGVFARLDAATGESEADPALDGYTFVDLGPGGRFACVEDRSRRLATGPIRLAFDDEARGPRVLAQGGSLLDVAWTEDGETLAAVVRQDSPGGPALPRASVLCMSADSEPRTVESLDPSDSPVHVSFSADGATLYVSTLREVVAVDRESLAVVHRDDGVTGSFAVLDPVLGIATNARNAQLWDLRSLERIRTMELDLPDATTDRASLRRLRTLGVDGDVVILDAAIAAPIGRLALATRAGVLLYEVRR